jgi:adenylate cyclase
LPTFAVSRASPEHATPEKDRELLNRYFSAMTDIIFAHGGTLDKYLGDGLMALFGAPDRYARRCIQCAQRGCRDAATLLESIASCVKKGFQEIGVGMGLHTGEAIVGYIGSDRRSEYTAIGDTVNTSSRLESNARGGEILISDRDCECGAQPLQAEAPRTDHGEEQAAACDALGS